MEPYAQAFLEDTNKAHVKRLVLGLSSMLALLISGTEFADRFTEENILRESYSQYQAHKSLPAEVRVYDKNLNGILEADEAKEMTQRYNPVISK